jgi:hypothetical protein
MLTSVDGSWMCAGSRCACRLERWEVWFEESLVIGGGQRAIPPDDVKTVQNGKEVVFTCVNAWHTNYGMLLGWDWE